MYDLRIQVWHAQLQHDLRVRLGLEARTGGGELGADARVVVDLARHNALDGPVFVRERLFPGFEVDDGEADVSEACARINGYEKRLGLKRDKASSPTWQSCDINTP
jgi:hypothetical protein